MSHPIQFEDEDVALLFQVVNDQPPEDQPPQEYMQMIAEDLDRIFDPAEYPLIRVY